MNKQDINDYSAWVIRWMNTNRKRFKYYSSIDGDLVFLITNGIYDVVSCRITARQLCYSKNWRGLVAQNIRMARVILKDIGQQRPVGTTIQ
jgi:hypothetical protein